MIRRQSACVSFAALVTRPTELRPCRWGPRVAQCQNGIDLSGGKWHVAFVGDAQRWPGTKIGAGTATGAPDPGDFSFFSVDCREGRDVESSASGEFEPTQRVEREAAAPGRRAGHVQHAVLAGQGATDLDVQVPGASFSMLPLTTWLFASCST